MELKEGAVINLENGLSTETGKEIGRGGQGIVYHVNVGGKPCALKWYTCKFADEKAFRKNLEKNIASGAPDGRFLWPLHLAGKEDGFGYVRNAAGFYLRSKKQKQSAGAGRSSQSC